MDFPAPRPGSEHDRLAIRRWWQQRCSPDNPYWHPREEAFRLMAAAGMGVVPHARLPGAPGNCGPDDLVVVYTDEHAHASEGKVLLPHARAAELHPGALCSVFLPPGGESYRLLKIGLKSHGLRYTSPDWQSNAGPEGDIQVTALPEGQPRSLPDGWPPVLWAVDFVAWQGQLIAVDLNPAPGIQGTGLLLSLSGYSVPGELLRYAEQRGERFWEVHP